MRAPFPIRLAARCIDHVTGRRRRLDPPLPPLSVKVARGEEWRCCSNDDDLPAGRDVFLADVTCKRAA